LSAKNAQIEDRFSLINLQPRHLEPMSDHSRRGFLRVLGGSAVVGAAGACGQGGAGPADVGDMVSAGNIATLPVDTLRTVGSNEVAIGRDQYGLYAMTLTCTHQSCNMAQQGRVDFGGVVCYCHNSHFSNNGDWLAGPGAPNPLQHFAVELNAAGEITIRGHQYVSASVRTAVT
jgi:nitrite reductase/ring-hydroxylating ferredoxin subunit